MPLAGPNSGDPSSNAGTSADSPEMGETLQTNEAWKPLDPNEIVADLRSAIRAARDAKPQSHFRLSSFFRPPSRTNTAADNRISPALDPSARTESTVDGTNPSACATAPPADTAPDPGSEAPEPDSITDSQSLAASAPDAGAQTGTAEAAAQPQALRGEVLPPEPSGPERAEKPKDEPARVITMQAGARREADETLPNA